MYDRGDSFFPYLKGKAAEVRNLVPVLCEVFKSLMDSTIKQHQQVALVVDMCSDMEAILDKFSDNFKLPADAAES